MYFFYFFPLGLDRPLRRRPVLTWALMALLTVVYLWQRWGAPLTGADPWDWVFFPGNSRAWTVATAIFLHGSWLHLLGNLLYLHVLAPPLEERLGRPALLGLVLVLGVGGNLAHGLASALNLFGQGGLGVMGASGAIAGLMALTMLRLYSARVVIAWWLFAPIGGQNKVGRTPVPVLWAVPLWILLQVAQMLLAPDTGATVSFGAHLGGFALGLFVGLVAGELKAGRNEAAAARGRRYFRDGHYHAAAGAWTEALADRPDDAPALAELARSLMVAGRRQEAKAAWRRLWDLHRADMRVDAALAVYDEACRAGLVDLLSPAEMSEAARFKELQLDYRGALDVYRRLYEQHPGDPQGQRALVRVIVLCRGRAADAEAAERWLHEAGRTLPPGPWREYLEREFNLAAAPREGVPAGLRALPRPAGS
ncbi:MAG: rhomboid family intramembrane serine protease [bacterium]|jgi:membrane associated rhomboid family serine protease|nr:rhomboid family intramembrane serine protease [bacterium]MBK9775502.1 rhomboid family intramembrane serine protease [bacterium]